MQEDVIPMDNYDVVAIRGEGVWIVDDSDNCWHVGGPHGDATPRNKLVADYRNAISD